jgi:hypothetical protein
MTSIRDKKASEKTVPLLWAAGGALAIGVLGVMIGRGSRQTVPEPNPASVSATRASVDGGTALPAPAASLVHYDITEDPSFAAGIPLRPMDREIFAALMNENLDRTKLPDLFPDRPYRVRIVGSAAEKRYGMVVIDMNRDGKIEERWSLKNGEVTREVPTDAAAGGGSVRYSLAHGKWQPH